MLSHLLQKRRSNLQPFIALSLLPPPIVAERYTNAIITHCEGMQTVPNRGTRRDDIRPSLRITNYKQRAVIAFAVDDAALMVTIIGIYYGGQDYEAALHMSHL